MDLDHSKVDLNFQVEFLTPQPRPFSLWSGEGMLHWEYAVGRSTKEPTLLETNGSQVAFQS